MSAGGDAPGGERRFRSRETRLCDVMTSPIASPDSPTIARAREGRPISGRPGLPRQTDNPRSTPFRPRRGERGQLAPSVALPPTQRRVRIAVALQQPPGRSRGRRQPGECRARSPAIPHPTLARPGPGQISLAFSPEKTDGPVPSSVGPPLTLTSVPSHLPARTNRRHRSTRRSSVTPPSSATASPTAAATGGAEEPANTVPPGPHSPSRMRVGRAPIGGPSGGRTSATREARTGAGAGRTDPSATRNATAAGAGRRATKDPTQLAVGPGAPATSRASTAERTRRNPPGRAARGSPWAGAGAAAWAAAWARGAAAWARPSGSARLQLRTHPTSPRFDTGRSNTRTPGKTWCRCSSAWRPRQG